MRDLRNFREAPLHGLYNCDGIVREGLETEEHLSRMDPKPVTVGLTKVTP